MHCGPSSSKKSGHGTLPVADRLVLVSDDLVTRVAQIIGPQSAAASALADVALRRAAGEDACIYERRAATSSSYVVGPRIACDGEDGKDRS